MAESKERKEASDAVLIARFKQGDPAAFEEIFQRYLAQIHRFSSRMCRDPDDAQDVLQETFLSAYKHLGSFQERSRLTTWLYKIASSACIKKRRRGKQAPREEISLEELHPGSTRRPDDPVVDWSERPLRDLQQKELQKVLDEAVAALPGNERLVLVLRDMEGLSARETGRALGLSVAAVKSRLHRARLFVRNRLNDYYEKEP
jgi:RNA polymerase sigma-70 factor (ECF subfamily)